MPFMLVSEDITTMSVDAIVNAANNRLQRGGGVCGAIFAQAGDALQRECDKIGYCGTGEAVITKGYGLRAKYIVHTVGPVYNPQNKYQSMELYSAYKASLFLAKKKGVTSIAFPLISSGVYGYPKKEAISIASKAITDFLKDNDMYVYLSVYDKDSLKADYTLFQSIQLYINEHLSLLAEPRICFDAAMDLHMLRGERACEALVKEKGRSLEDIINKRPETFSEMMLRLIDEKGMSDVEVYKRANIDRKLFSKMRKRDYVPKKTTIIAIAVSLQLNLDETRDLLQRAGFALSPSGVFDIIIEYFIKNEIYDIYQINEALFYFDQTLLGA